MKLTLYRADCSGDAKNCVYPHKAAIQIPKDLATAAAFDHVFANYLNSYRNIDNFLESDVVPMDCDNDHREAPKDCYSPDPLEENIPKKNKIILMN